MCPTCHGSLVRQGERTSHTNHREMWLLPWGHSWYIRMWGGQSAPTDQPGGMENSAEIPPRRELLALAGRSLHCPWATLHVCLELLGLAERERASRYSSAVMCSLRFSWDPSIIVCHSLPSAGTLGVVTMDRLLSYLLLLHGITSSRADRIWHFFALSCITWIFQLVW